MAERGHYDINSTTVRAHVSAAGGKAGFINGLVAARGAGSPAQIHSYAGRRGGLLDLRYSDRSAGADAGWTPCRQTYDADAIRDDLKKRSIKAVIPPKSNRMATIGYSKHL